jgi:membrane protein involved in colicin uptake
LKFFEKEVDCPLSKEKKQPSKKIQNIFKNSISSFFLCNKTFQERGCATKIKFGRLGSFNYQKSSSFKVCGE